MMIAAPKLASGYKVRAASFKNYDINSSHTAWRNRKQVNCKKRLCRPERRALFDGIKKE